VLDGRKSSKKFSVKSGVEHLFLESFLEKKANGCQLPCVCYCKTDRVPDPEVAICEWFENFDDACQETAIEIEHAQEFLQ
jgi:hypothetical protein